MPSLDEAPDLPFEMPGSDAITHWKHGASLILATGQRIMAAIMCQRLGPSLVAHQVYWLDPLTRRQVDRDESMLEGMFVAWNAGLGLDVAYKCARRTLVEMRTTDDLAKRWGLEVLRIIAYSRAAAGERPTEKELVWDNEIRVGVEVAADFVLSGVLDPHVVLPDLARLRNLCTLAGANPLGFREIIAVEDAIRAVRPDRVTADLRMTVAYGLSRLLTMALSHDVEF